ncbi:MAG: KTSC domain-containing protein, partial [Abditibacteriota bacterium]|nr:KTSC domain-containing protein [Abditibacteriota bacterium]
MTERLFVDRKTLNIILLGIAALILLCGCSPRRPDTAGEDPGKVSGSTALVHGSVDMTEVDSTVIAEEGYDKGRRTLYLRFSSNGALYAYYDVDEDVYRELLRAESKGTFFGKRIKDKYRYDKLESGEGYRVRPLYDETSYDRAAFVVNYSSGRFHTKDCKYADSGNVACVSNSRSELEEMGYHACRLCLPD